MFYNMFSGENFKPNDAPFASLKRIARILFITLRCPHTVYLASRGALRYMSEFENATPQFDAFLKRAKDDSTLDGRRNGAPPNTRFIPRSFLLEEHLDPSRVASYATFLPNDGAVSFDEWNTAHNEYLNRLIFCKPPGTHDYRYIEPDNPDICPETFRGRLALIPFQGTDLDTHFIRIIPVSDLAYLSGESAERIVELGTEVAADPSGSSAAHVALSIIFDTAFNGAVCDHRPVFAAFYEDFLDELDDLADTTWPDKLRNRLGLYHINQWQPGGLPRAVFLFRYPVRELPRHPDDADRRPISIPVVLDHRLSEAFCPAPTELGRGRLLNLKAGAFEEPAREVLHLFMPMQVEHLFRVGFVETPVPEDLAPARRDHLLWMRLEANREDYASETDDDLF